MRLWAYGTSPQGLGLHPSDFWTLSIREFYALESVQQADARRWAISQVIYVNAHLASGEEPFLADDFLGTGNREKRYHDRMEGQRAAAKLNRKLLEIRPVKPGEAEPEWLPAWARMTEQEKRQHGKHR